MATPKAEWLIPSPVRRGRRSAASSYGSVHAPRARDAAKKVSVCKETLTVSVSGVTYLNCSQCTRDAANMMPICKVISTVSVSGVTYVNYSQCEPVHSFDVGKIYK